VNEVIVGRWYAIDEVFENNSELLHQLLGLFGDGEGAVVYGGKIEVVEDLSDVVLLFGGFVGCYDWFWGEAFLVLLRVSWELRAWDRE
jgi:hypothetical protein